MRINILSLFIALVLTATKVAAQTLSPSVIPTQGGDFVNGGVELSWTMGETATETYTSGGSMLSQGFQQPEVDLITGTITTGSYCNGGVVSVPFTAYGIVDPANVFTAQLSDASGSFSNPDTVGTLTGTLSGTINGTIPLSTPAGTHYRIRVTSSNPDYTGIPNTVDIVVITCGPDVWLGNTTNWFTNSNWTWNVPPNATVDAIIPTGVPNYPQITGIVTQTAKVKSITIQANAGVSVMGVNNVNLEIYGDLTNDGIASFGPGKVIFKGTTGQTMNGNSLFGKLDINNTNGVTLSATGMQSIAGVLSLVNGTLTTNGKLTITSDIAGAGVVNDFTAGNNGNISGNITVQRYVVNPGTSFYFVGTPVGGATISQWGSEFSLTPLNGAVDGSQVIPFPDCRLTGLYYSSPYGGLFDYRENTVTFCNLQGWHVRLSGSIPTGAGFAGRIPDATTVALTGSYNTGAFTSPSLTRTATNTTGSKGFNLSSNPYASPIEWLDVAAANPGIQGTAYTYVTTGPFAGTYNPNNTLTGGGQIGSSEGFWVDAISNGATVSYNNSMRRVGPNAFLRNSPAYDHLLTLNVTGNGYADKALIAFGTNFTAGFDRDYDARKLKSKDGQPSLYATDAGEEFAIYAHTSPAQVKQVPVSLEPGTSGVYMITANDLQTFDANQIVYLEDLKLHKMQNLVANNTYQFSADANDDPARFIVHFTLKTDTVTGTTEPKTESVKINGYSGTVEVLFHNFTSQQTLTMNLYDVTGRKIIPQREIATGDGRYAVNLNDIVTGYYFVVLTGNDYQKAEKVLLSSEK